MNNQKTTSIVPAQAQYFSLKEIENLDITYPALLSLARRAIKKGTSLL